MKAKDQFLDVLGVLNDMYSISGGSRKTNSDDNQRRLYKAIDKSTTIYKQAIIDQAERILGLDIAGLS